MRSTTRRSTGARSRSLITPSCSTWAWRSCRASSRGCANPGASADLPAALVERASLAEQRIVRGTLADHRANRPAKVAIAPPALLIVGEVAALARTDLDAVASAADDGCAHVRRCRGRRSRMSFQQRHRRGDRQHAADPPARRERGDRLRDSRQGRIHESRRLGEGSRRARHRRWLRRTAAHCSPAAPWSKALRATPASGSRTSATRAAIAASS